MSYKNRPEFWRNWAETGNFDFGQGQTQQQRDTVGGIMRPATGKGAVGGYAMGNPILTANTGFTGSDGNKVGTGGGQVINQSTPIAELLLARPDLADNNFAAQNFWQHTATPAPKKVAPANTASAARSQSLRDFGAAKAAQRYKTANTRTKAAQEGSSNG